MKVLEHTPWVYQFECKGCRAKLEAEASDVRVRVYETDDESSRRYYIPCGVCGDPHPLEGQALPSDVRNKAKRG